MEQELARWLHRPEPLVPDVDPDPVPLDDDDDLPPDPSRRYRYPEGDPPGRKPPVHAPPVSPAPRAGVMPCRGGPR